MADLNNQENFNKIFSFFLGIVLIISIMTIINKNRIIIVENSNF
jgi:hypothetical protein